MIGQYSVTRYIDTRDLTQAPSFLVTCLQRFIIFPKESFDFGKTPASYSDYVALLEAELRPVVSEGTQIRLIDYWPRTLNAAVSTDISETGTQENGVLRQHTSGSSTSTTNSFGVNLGVTGGVGAEGPTGSGTLGGNFEHSSTRSSSVEDTVGSSLSRSMQLTGAASITIKDWASFATIVESESNGHPSLRWIWGQEYPWDLFQFRAANDAGDVELPKFMQDRLGDAVAGWVAPPSQLAMFGLDLVAHATWQVIPPDGAIMSPTMDFKLRGKVGRGNHSIGDVPAHGAQFPLVDGTTEGIRRSLATYEYRTTPVSPPPTRCCRISRSNLCSISRWTSNCSHLTRSTVLVLTTARHLASHQRWSADATSRRTARSGPFRRRTRSHSAAAAGCRPPRTLPSRPN